MPNINSVKKDVRRSEKRRIQNSMQRARLRTYDKKVRSCLNEGKIEEARTYYIEFSRYLDRAGKRNLIHHRQADRRKSRIALLINKKSLEK